VPVIQKLSTDELMESNTYQRFSQCVDMIFENTEDFDLNAEIGKLLARNLKYNYFYP
jgi:cohesin loading factor subunit SCC2